MYLKSICNFTTLKRQLGWFSNSNLHNACSNIHKRTIYHDASKKFFCERLNERKLIHISGQDSSSLLQGLVTNDLFDLNDDKRSIFSFLLNIQGRVLYDLVLHRSNEKSLYVECDKSVSSDLVSLIKKYKIRKKVSVNAADDYCVWSIFPKEENTDASAIDILSPHNDFILSRDPRVASFGWRAVCKNSDDLPQLFTDQIELSDGRSYKGRRLSIGIAEGIVDFPPGNCFPLESNAVFSNGVSFTKGCFIGQELTARTQHLGVTRKRLMPLLFRRDDHTCKSGGAVFNQHGKKCGAIRDISGIYGIGLMRLPDVIGKGQLMARGEHDDICEVIAIKPEWWKSDSDKLLTQLQLQSIDKSLT